jgi:dihydroorotase
MDTVTLHLTKSRLIEPEPGTDAPGSLTVKDGVIVGRGVMV